MDIDVGTVIAGKYELVRLLGKGAMGEVWLATHNSLGGEFAVKLVETTDDVEAETAAGRFQLEAQIAAKLSRRTRHIVSVSDHGEEGGMAYLVMELLEGESLETRLKRTGRLDLPETAAIVMQVGRALALAHDEQIFHRDLKPANIFLTKDEDGRMLVKLLDFGIARAVKPFKTRSPFATSKDMVLGTPSYMSPEQARGLDSLDHRCDLWALATCAYEALAKRIPFEGDTVEDIFLSICTFRVLPLRLMRPDLDASVEAFFAKAFAPSLDERFAKAQALADAFEALVEPSSLEPFLGLGGVSPSGRRLPAAVPASAPDLAAAAATPTSPAMQTQPGLGGATPVAVGVAPTLGLAESAATRSSGNPMPASLDTLANAGVPKKRSGLFIGGGALVAVAVVAIAVFALRETPSKATGLSSDPPSTVSAPVVKVAERVDVPPPPEPTETAVATSTATPTATTAVAPTTTTGRKDPRKPGRNGGHGTTTTASHAPTTATPTTAPAPTHPPAPTASQAPKKGTHDKGEVF